MSKSINYEQAGVSIDANDEMVERIDGYVSSTFGPRVMGKKGAFAGMFRLDYDERLFKRNYKNPVLVACTDGVGSKVQLAGQIKKYDTVGIDLVAMSVNDMLVQGAEPLFFLDYLAVNKLEPGMVSELVKGVAAGCRQADCALIGGETAEMPDTYRKGDFDMAGFAVGIVERKRIIDGNMVHKGDVILGLGSSGLHSNGYTLVRNICFKKCGLKMSEKIEGLEGAVLGDVLLEPTRIYVRVVVKLLSQYKVKRVVHGMAHITGGGLVGNIPRVLPKDCNANIKKSSWPVPKIFSFIQEAGPVDEEEDFADSIQKKLSRYGEKVYRIGRVSTGSGKVVLK
ncbi:MAG: phosphoribosylformylglycinamidine cyclo-ligase [Planctomycetota bacterium]|jgi:phosphoribosylformylglycinamidine cyclo-ligase